MPACRHESVSTSSGSCSFPIPWLSPWSPWGAPLVSAFTAAVVFVARRSNRSSSPRSSGRKGQKKHVARRCAPPRSKEVQFTEATLCQVTCKSCNGRSCGEPLADQQEKNQQEDDVWQPQGGLQPFADLVEQLLPPWIISNMEIMTKHTSNAVGLPAFIEHSMVVASWDISEQRSFGARLLRKTVPEPVAQLFGAILNALKIWPDLHSRAIRFGSSTIGAATSHWLVGETRVLSPEEEQALVQKLRHEGLDVAPDGVMLLRKCKFIEESGGCKDLCLNVCKAGTEEYMKEDLQFPVRMIPNLKDHSCAILLMEQPVPPDKDPLFKQPCGAAHCDKKFTMPRMPHMRHMPRTRSGSESEAEQRQKESHNYSCRFLV